MADLSLEYSDETIARETAEALALLRTPGRLPTPAEWEVSRNGNQPQGSGPKAHEAPENATADATAYWRPAILTPDDLLNAPPKPWLIPNLIGQGDECYLDGEWGAGKSLILLDLFFAAGLARTFAMTARVGFTPVRPLQCVLFVGEGQAAIADRVAALCEHYAVSRPPFTVVIQVPQLFDDRAPSHVVGLLNAWSSLDLPPRPDIVGIDTFSRATVSANESDTRDVGIVHGQLARLRRDLGCASIMVHHPTKSGSSPARGSGAILGDPDVHLLTQVVRPRSGDDPLLGKLTAHKGRDGQGEGLPVHYRLNRIDGVRGAEQWPYTTAVVEWIDDGDDVAKSEGDAKSRKAVACIVPGERVSVETVAQRCSVSKSTARRWLEEAVNKAALNAVTVHEMAGATTRSVLRFERRLDDESIQP